MLEALGADHLIPGGGGGMVFLPNQIIFFLPSRKQNFFFLPEQKQTIFFLRFRRQTFFFQDMFEDSFNCETGMRGSRVGLQ